MNELVVSERPKSQFWLVVDARPFRASLSDKPKWLPTREWVQLITWLVMVTDRNVPSETEWYRLIDYVYRALVQSLTAQRIINLDVEVEAREALPKVAEVHRWITPILYPVLQLLYPHIQQGYKLEFDRLTMEGCYLRLVLY